MTKHHMHIPSLVSERQNSEAQPSRPSLPPDLPRDNYPYPPPPLRNGSGWDGVKVITGPWIFVPTHFISARLPTGKSMSSALMKHPHLCPMELLVFIFSPNMAPMRSLDTATHTGQSGEGEENPEMGQVLPVRFVVFRLHPLGGLPYDYAVWW